MDLKYTRDAFKAEIFIQNINHTRFHPVQLNTNNQPISCIIYKMYPRTQEAGSQSDVKSIEGRGRYGEGWLGGHSAI